RSKTSRSRRSSSRKRGRAASARRSTSEDDAAERTEKDDRGAEGGVASRSSEIRERAPEGEGGTRGAEDLEACLMHGPCHGDSLVVSWAGVLGGRRRSAILKRVRFRSGASVQRCTERTETDDGKGNGCDAGGRCVAAVRRWKWPSGAMGG